MAHTDPHTALLEHVADLGFYRAQPPSVRVLKRRDLPGRQLYAIAFTTQEGHDAFCACELRQQEDGTWTVHGSAGGGLGVPRRETPWANLGGSPGNQASGCYFGGRIEGDPTGEIVRVRLVCANDLTLEDTVEEGIVLFLGERAVDLPLFAELYDRAGQMVASHLALRMPARRGSARAGFGT
jgi:hypothetical protein